MNDITTKEVKDIYTVQDDAELIRLLQTTDRFLRATVVKREEGGLQVRTVHMEDYTRSLHSIISLRLEHTLREFKESGIYWDLRDRIIFELDDTIADIREVLKRHIETMKFEWHEF